METQDIKAHPNWVEINLDNLKSNYLALKKICEDTRICGVVKADAYGHGAIAIAKKLSSLGVDYFAVSSLEEGLELRNAGIKGNIMMMTALIPGSETLAIENKIESTVYSYETAERINNIAKALGHTYDIHIKIDTGMARIGFLSNQSSLKVIEQISRMKNLNLRGIFTHFASADEAYNYYTKHQYQSFMDVVKSLRAMGVNFEIKHVDNDAGLMMYNYREDMVRLGIGLYGLYPSSYVRAKANINLKPVMKMKSILTHVKTIRSGETVGYGQSYTVLCDTKVGTVGIGYADGYPRSLSNKGFVEIKGKKCPIIGRVCMDMMMIDLGNMDIEPGEEVLIFGSDTLSATDLAKEAGTISYEIISSVSRRVPRIYIEGGDKIKVVSYIK